MKKDFGFGGLTPTGTPAPDAKEGEKKGFALGGLGGTSSATGSGTGTEEKKGISFGKEPAKDGTEEKKDGTSEVKGFGIGDKGRIPVFPVPFPL